MGVKITGRVTTVPTITEAEVQEWYKKAHAASRFSGHVYETYISFLNVVFPDWASLRVLDYGCGPSGGIVSKCPAAIGYDPYVTQFATNPWKGNTFDLFFSSDVFEHLTESQVAKILKQIATGGIPRVFLAIATRPAKKTFDNEVNIHRTVRPSSWWRTYVGAKLGDRYELVLHVKSDDASYVVLAFQAKQDEVVVSAKAA